MSDAVANYESALDALNAKIYEGRHGDDSPDLQRSLETLINSVAPAAEAAALRPPPARPRVQPQPPARDEDLLWSNPPPRRRAASDAESLEDVNSDAERDASSIDLDAEPLKCEVEDGAFAPTPADHRFEPPSPPPRTLKAADLAGLATQLRVSPPPRTKGAGRAERAARPAAEDAALAQFDSEDEEARPAIVTADTASFAPKREFGQSTPVRNKSKAQAYEGAAGEPKKGPYKPSPRK